jgi:hypothetical protein
MKATRVLGEAAASVLLTLALVGSAYAIDITSCGQSVPDGEAGILQEDLDCSGIQGDGVILGMRSVIDLNGHKIIAPPFAGNNNGAVGCRFGGPICRERNGVTLCRGRSSCTVVSHNGRAEIFGGTAAGIASDGDLVVENVDIHDVETGLYAHGKLRATDVSVLRCSSNGMYSRDLRLTNVESSDNGGLGVWCQYPLKSRVRGTGLTTVGNALGGVACYKFNLTGFVAHGNGAAAGATYGGGVYSFKGVLTDSVVTDNLYEFGEEADVLAARRPTLINTICGHSVRFYELTWGVCSGD